MIEMTVKFLTEKVNYTDKAGQQKSFDKLVMETPNGQRMNLKADQFNYRVVDFIKDELRGGA